MLYHVWDKHFLTRDAILRSGIQIDDPSCLVCTHILETARHIFLGCLNADLVWTEISQWFNIPFYKVDFLEDLFQQASSVMANDTRRRIRTILIMVRWHIWKARNDKIFNNSPWSLPCIIKYIKTWSATLINNLTKKGN